MNTFSLPLLPQTLAVSSLLFCGKHDSGDIDPKGLSIAQSYPNFAGLIAPATQTLEAYFNNPGKANPKLYEKQLAGCHRALSDTRYSIIQACWQLIKKHQAGIVQAHWLVYGTILSLNPVQSEQ